MNQDRSPDLPDHGTAELGTRIRHAAPGEADLLTRLALRSKRLWGYGDEFIDRVAHELAIHEADLVRDHVEVLETGTTVAGFFRLSRRPDVAWLEDLFVDPEHVGRGFGRRLLQRAAEVARGWGCRAMELDSDPFAEPFYLHLGARRVGTTASLTFPGRALPRMRLEP